MTDVSLLGVFPWHFGTSRFGYAGLQYPGMKSVTWVSGISSPTWTSGISAQSFSSSVVKSLSVNSLIGVG